MIVLISSACFTGRIKLLKIDADTKLLFYFTNIYNNSVQKFVFLGF